mgnify:CR=1 FL=1
MKSKRCGVCHKRYVPVRPIQPTCLAYECQVAYATKAIEKARREQRERREKLKRRSDWMREAQAAFNAWVRARDAHLPCISCGRYHDGQWHAGHYRSVGSCPELRFEALNCWRQCAPCNTHLHGNLVGYRTGLVERIGREKVEWLESDHPPRKYTIDDLKRIKAEYKRRLRELRAGSGGPEGWMTIRRGAEDQHRKDPEDPQEGP